MTSEKIIERLKKITERAMHLVGETPFVMSLDDGVAIHEAIEALKQPEQRWIPLTMREMTEEEKQYYIDIGCSEKAEDGNTFDCPLPDDGQEVLISIGGYVTEDIFCIDIEGCDFENANIDDVDAWMPKPAPFEPQEGEVRV